jgi:myxalamid-type polyketide synthase MxaB
MTKRRSRCPLTCIKAARSAIVGVGCRFPGVNDPAAFRQLLRDGVDAIREVPADRP